MLHDKMGNTSVVHTQTHTACVFMMFHLFHFIMLIRSLILCQIHLRGEQEVENITDETNFDYMVMEIMLLVVFMVSLLSLQSSPVFRICGTAL